MYHINSHILCLIGTQLRLYDRKFVRGENDARSKFRVNDRIQEKVNDLLHDGDGEV